MNKGMEAGPLAQESGIFASWMQQAVWMKNDPPPRHFLYSHLKMSE